MKKDRSKNKHISKNIEFKKNLKINFDNQEFNIIKSKHLYDFRKSKQRDQFVSDDIYKNIIHLALKNGLQSFRRQNLAVVTIANSKKKNYYCSSFLIAIDYKNNITIITIVQTYGNKKWYRGFTKIPNRINIIPSVYIIPRLTDEEISEKERDRIFNSKEASKEDTLFLKYAKYNNL